MKGTRVARTTMAGPAINNRPRSSSLENSLLSHYTIPYPNLMFNETTTLTRLLFHLRIFKNINPFKNIMNDQIYKYFYEYLILLFKYTYIYFIRIRLCFDFLEKLRKKKNG